MEKSELAKKVYEVAHLEGDFLLRSDKRSNVYFDKYQFEARPDILSGIAQEMKALIPDGTELLGALEMGGIPVATALSLITGIPVVFLRKEAKAYGTCKFAEGPDVKEKQVCLIEDVITTGGQVVETTGMLRQEGAVIQNVLCVIDRSQGQTEKLDGAQLKMSSLFQMKDLLPE